MARFPDPRSSRSGNGSGLAATLIMLAVAAIVIVIGMIAFPSGQEPTDRTAANQQGTAVPNTPPPVRTD